MSLVVYVAEVAKPATLQAVGTPIEQWTKIVRNSKLLNPRYNLTKLACTFFYVQMRMKNYARFVGMSADSDDLVAFSFINENR